MTLIEWRREFETGIADVDYEHAHLIDLINSLYRKLEEHPSTSVVSDMLGEIFAKISSHFALEEKIMRDQKYPAFAERRETHHRLLDQVREIMDAYDAGSHRVGRSLPATLRQWLFQAMSIDVDLFGKLKAVNLRKWGLTQG